jgi:zinc protease
VEFPVPDAFTLQNGLTVYVVERPRKLVTIAVVTRHGASSVPKGKSGLAALTARMMTEGTKTKSAATLAEAAESLGSTLEHDAGRDYSSVSLTTLAEDVPAGLGLLAEVVREPALSAKELERVRGEWIDGLKSERQAPERLASLAGLRLLLGEPAGAPVGGSIPDVKALAIADVRAFHRDAWQPDASLVVVAGDVSSASTRSAVEQAFGSWRGKAAASRPSEAQQPAPAARRVVVIDRPGSVQSALFAAQPFPNRAEPGFEARQVLNGVVGGLFTSRINKNLREVHAYTYGARSDCIATRAWGAFVVSTSVETGVTAPALRELLRELGRARNPNEGSPIEAEEVRRARADLVSGLGAHLEQTERIVSDLAQAFAAGLGPRYFNEYGGLLGRIGPDEVAAEARRLDPDRLLIVIVGDKAAITSQIEGLGMKVESAPDALTE